MLVNTILLLLMIIFLESIFSMDNALVLAELASHLPKDKPVKFPRLLKFLEKYFPSQQEAALKLGLIGAYLGRGIMLLFAEFIVKHHIIKILGALYLIHLALHNLGELAIGSETYEQEIEHDLETLEQKEKKVFKKLEKGFWGTVLVIELSDLAFSLDNVVAIVVLSNHFFVIFLGVALGILIIRFAANKLIKLVERFPALGTAAYILILNIGIELLLAEFLHIHFTDVAKFLISLVTVILAIIYDKYLNVNLRKRIDVFLKHLGKVFYFTDYYATFRWLWGKKVEVEK